MTDRRTEADDPALVERQRTAGDRDDAPAAGTATDDDAPGSGGVDDPSVAPPEEEEAARLGDFA